MRKGKYFNWYFLLTIHRGYNEQKEELKYDPEQDRIFTIRAQASRYKYMFQGQEFIVDLNYDFYQFKWRHYSPSLGRFISEDPLMEDFPQWSVYLFSGNMVTISKEAEGLEPKFMIDNKGHLTAPIISLLNAAFGYSRESLKNTTWVVITDRRAHWFARCAVPDRATAITLGDQVVYDDKIQSQSIFKTTRTYNKYWFSLIAHEQRHRRDIDKFSSLIFYYTYMVDGIFHLGEHDNIIHEKVAMKMEEYAEELWDSYGDKINSVLESNISNDEKSMILASIGAKFRRDVILNDLISEKTSLINQAKKQLDNLEDNRENIKVKSFLQSVINSAQNTINKAKKEQKYITDKYGK